MKAPTDPSSRDAHNAVVQQPWPARLGLRLSAIFEKSAPDPFVLAVGLTVAAFILALVFGVFTDPATGQPARGLGAMGAALDAWTASSGLWAFLGFAMQMCLILITGHALASSPPVRTLIHRLADLPASGPAAAALVAAVAIGFGLINWGLGLMVGALLARAVGERLTRRSIPHHYPCIAAAGYAGMLVWHGGLSGSAPLKMTTAAEAASVLPPEAIERLTQAARDTGTTFTGIGLEETVFSPMNLIVTGGLAIIAPLVFWWLSPRGAAGTPCVIDGVPSETAQTTAQTTGQTTAKTAANRPRAASVPEWLERTPIVPWALALLLLAGVWRYAQSTSLTRIGLNEINATALGLGLVLHGSIASYARAAEDAARGCAGIIIQFPLYAGVMALLVTSGLVAKVSAIMASAAGATGLPVLTYASAAAVNLFVPSGGGQWGVQGPIALEAGSAAGVDPAVMIMAVAYGDQLTNMLQPFWALPLLAITRVKARQIVGYTAIVMVAAAAWTIPWLLIF